MYVLLTTDVNWAGEMDLEGVAIIPEEEWDATYAVMEKYFEVEGEWVDSNQSISFRSFSAWERSFVVRSRLTEVDRRQLITWLGLNEYGTPSLGFVKNLFPGEYANYDVLDELGYY